MQRAQVGMRVRLSGSSASPPHGNFPQPSRPLELERKRNRHTSPQTKNIADPRSTFEFIARCSVRIGSSFNAITRSSAARPPHPKTRRPRTVPAPDEGEGRAWRNDLTHPAPVDDVAFLLQMSAEVLERSPELTLGYPRLEIKQCMQEDHSPSPLTQPPSTQSQHPFTQSNSIATASSIPERTIPHPAPVKHHFFGSVVQSRTADVE
jgi:hypothetical protein